MPEAGVATIWANSSPLSGKLLRCGFKVRSYQCAVTAADGFWPEGDVNQPENQKASAALVLSGSLLALRLVPDSVTWVSYQSSAPTTRMQDKPQGDGSLDREVRSNKTLAVHIWFIWICVMSGVSFSIQCPRRSVFWNRPVIRLFESLPSNVLIDSDQCAWVRRPDAWTPAGGDMRVMRAARIMTNNRALESLKRLCSDSVQHGHDSVVSRSRVSSRPQDEASNFPSLLKSIICPALRASLLKGLKIPAEKLLVLPG